MPQSFNTVVHLFMLYRVVSRFSFYVPIYVVALLAREFSFLEIGGVLFVYGVATMGFGRMAERLLHVRGPAAAIVRGELFKLASNALIGVVVLNTFEAGDIRSLAVLLVAQVLGGIGYCYAAVGDGTYLSHAAMKLGTTNESQVQAQARSSSYMFMSFLLAGGIGAAVYPFMPSLPFFMTSVANLLAALIIVFWLKESGGTAQEARATKGGKKGVFRDMSRAAKIDIFGYAFLRATVLTLQLLILPVWFFLGLHVEVFYFGILFGFYTFSGFLGGRFYPRLAARLSPVGAVTFILITTFISMLALALGHVVWITVIAPVGIFCSAGMLRPAFLPSLSQAKTQTGEPINAVAMAERLFGALSAMAYLAYGTAFYFGWRPEQLVLVAAAFVALVIVLRALLMSTRSYSKAVQSNTIN